MALGIHFLSNSLKYVLTCYVPHHIFTRVKQMTLKEARKRRGLTQEQLEARSGVIQPVISRLERGRVLDPAFSTVLKLADALKVDPRALRFGQPESVTS